ncbi:MAG TPA: DNA internalization-related competence protein ComEC/Rec2 [Casimicrobiaceae bacterium]|nr:DNA internalization-related competence protein ComEC/Rec2 [Casimicrobiaceae bacterium]
MKHTIAALLAYAAGVVLLQACSRLPPAAGWLFAAAAFLAVSTVLLARRAARQRDRDAAHAAPRPGRNPPQAARIHAIAVVASVVACGLCGFGYAAWRADMRLADQLPPAWEERDIRLTGVVDDLPHHGPQGTRFAFAVLHVDTVGAIVPSRISLAWFAPRRDESSEVRGAPAPPAAPVIQAGECWSLTVRLKRPHGNVNPGGFDLEAWLLERNLRATGYVRVSPDNRRACAFGGRATDHVQRARERIRTRIAKALPGAPYAGVLTALAIGDQRAIPESQWSVFNRTGVTHLVSISGLHVTIFAMLAGNCAFLLARRCVALTSRVPARKVAVGAGALFAFGYVLLAGAEVPAVRTLLMLCIAAAGLWLGRPGTALVVWTWSLALVLAWDPWAALTPGFWLSFGAVGLLLYAGSGRLAPSARGTVRDKLLEAIHQSTRAQWVVTLGLVPGTLALFGQLSLVSALANAIAIPAITLAVVPLTLSAIALPIDLLFRVAHAILQVVMRCLEWLATSPAAAWTTHAPREWTVGVAIAGVIWLFAPRGVPGRVLGAAWLLPLILLKPPAVPHGSVRVTVLDVGQGLAVVTATARHVLVYDAGPRYGDAADAGARIVVPFLRATGINRIDTLVVSHADSDHSGGALSLMRALPVGTIVSSLPDNHPIVVHADASVRRTRCAAGMQWTWDGVTFRLLHPRPRHYDEPTRKSNDLSCVLHITAGDRRLLLTGDIEAPSEADLLVQGTALAADAIVVPHHGSRTSSTAEFVAAVAPSVAIVAAGYRNRFGHPRADVLMRYRRAGAAQVRTDLAGAITLTLDSRAAPLVQGERDRRRRYWYDALDAASR